MLVLAVVSAAAAAGPGPNRVSTLRNQTGALDARAHRALLDLYALDTQLQSARAQLQALRARSARLRTEQVLLAQQLAATHRTLQSSRVQLSENLRTLYEQGDSTDALAVMLGAKSLDDAVTTLDDLTRVADQSRRVVAVTNAAEIRLAGLRATLGARRAELGTALVAARRTAGALVSARSERLAFLAQLRAQQALKAQQIAALQAAAQRVVIKSQQLQSAAAASAAALPQADPPPAPIAAPAPVSSPGGRTLTVSSTGYSLPGHTATGMPVGWGVVAVDPTVIPLGTRLTIPGYGDAVAADTGSAVRGATIDLWFPSLAQARAWGRRTVTITLH